MRSSRLCSGIGGVLILTGALVPRATLVEFLREVPEGLAEQLRLGGTLFKIGLILLGLFAITLGRVSVWTSGRQSQKPAAERHRHVVRAILAGMLITASVLRFYALDGGLWLDEVLTYVEYARMPFGEIVTTYHSENQHFLYTLLAHASFLILGESAWSLRLPAVLFGIGSIWALYMLGRYVGGAREALLAAAMLAFSYHHVWFSQNARGYTGLLFWTLLASWLLLRGLREARPQLWLFYAIAVALGVYTHITMLFVFLGHFIIYLSTPVVRRRAIWHDTWAGLFIGFCAAGLLTLQLHALALPQMIGGIAGTKSVVAGWRYPLWTFHEFAKGMQVNFAGGIVALAVLLVFGAGLVSFARTDPVVVQLLTVPALIEAIVVVGRGHHLWPRLFFFTIGFGALIVVRGTTVVGHMVARLFDVGPTNSAALGTAWCAVLIAVSAISLPLAYAPKQDYLGARAFVEASREPGDRVVTVGLATYPYQRLYKVDWEAAETVEALNAIRSRAKRTWVLYTFPPVLEAVHPEIMASIRRDFDVVKRFNGTLGGGTVFVCRSDIPLSYLPRVKRDIPGHATFRVKNLESVP